MGLKTTCLFCLALLALGALSNSCSGDCDVWFSRAIVSGRVTDGDALDPIPNTQIRVEVLVFANCGDAGEWMGPQHTMTDSTGNYSIELNVANTTGDMCVQVTETNSGEMANDVVEFVGGCNEDRAPERLTVDLAISE